MQPTVADETQEEAPKSARVDEALITDSRPAAPVAPVADIPRTAGLFDALPQEGSAPVEAEPVAAAADAAVAGADVSEAPAQEAPEATHDVIGHEADKRDVQPRHEEGHA